MHDRRLLPRKRTTSLDDLEVAIDLFWDENPSYRHHVKTRIGRAEDGKACIIFHTEQKESWHRLIEKLPDGNYYGQPAGIELHSKL